MNKELIKEYRDKISNILELWSKGALGTEEAWEQLDEITDEYDDACLRAGSYNP